MKPWTNPVFQTSCRNCGRPGWNRNAVQGWLGVEFVCKNGCDPEDVKRYQLKLANEKAKRLKEKAELCCDGAGI